MLATEITVCAHCTLTTAFQSFRHALAPALNRAFPCIHGPWTGSRVLDSEDRVCQCCSAHVLTAWSEAWAERVDTRGLKQHGAQGRLQAFASCTRVTASARHRGRGGAFELNLLGPQHAAAPNVPSRANLRSCGNVRRRRGRGGSGRATSSAGEIASIDAFFRRQELLGLTAVRPYGRFQSRASCSEEPSSALMARFARDRGRLRSRRKRRVNPRSYFDADPGQSGPLSQRRAPVGDSVPHGAAVERRSAQRPNFYAPFLATVYTRGQF